jgi:hypothetical protein
MKPDDFEKRLQSQPLRQIPTEWREQILRGASSSQDQPATLRHSFLSTLIHQLSAALWLKPAAWAGVAAGWAVIFALQSTQTHTGRVATASAQRPSTSIMSFKEEQQTLAELMGNNQPDDMDRPRHAAPKPRSELRGRYRVA